MDFEHINKHAEIAVLGAIAYFEGKSVFTNPFEHGTLERQIWWRGYVNAFKTAPRKRFKA